MLLIPEHPGTGIQDKSRNYRQKKPLELELLG